MIRKRKYVQVISAIFLTSLLFLTSCSSQPPSRFDQAQQESKQAGSKNTAVVKDAKQGGNFNKFFPSSGNGYERVFTQEKQGFAQAKLKKNGQEVAIMTISDTISNRDAQSAFKKSTKSIDGYPSVEKGKKTTSVLVADRFQVKVSSRDTSFSKDDRILWLEKFNLDGLAQQK